jgi:hypothetical protein
MHRIHRQVLSLVYGISVTAIAVLALNQGSTPTVIVPVVGMSMLTLMLIFGVEIDRVRILDKVDIEFTDGPDQQRDSDAPVETEKTD